MIERTQEDKDNFERDMRKIADSNKRKVTDKGKAWIKEHGFDGHSIYRADAIPFADLGLDKAAAKRLVQTFKSDTRNPKSTIFKDGRVVKETRGVYLLNLWHAIADNLGVGNAGAMFYGRGSQARALCSAIVKTLEDEKTNG
jgi:hypothetical protein